MTIMMTPPENEKFRPMLKSYLTEPDDAGFSNDILRAIQTKTEFQNNRLVRLRTGFVMGGCFMGGIIAALQLKPAWALVAASTVSNGPLTLTAIFGLFAFAVWASLDSRDAGAL